jgi:hypothetical protein
MVLTAAIRGPLRDQPALQRSDGTPLFAAGAPGYVGISEGAILGGAMVSLNPDLPRAILHVGGCGFTQMMMRARPFSLYLSFLATSLPDPLDQQKFIATLQRQFDRFDPATYAALLQQKRVLLQNGLGDSQVPNLGTYLWARLLNVPLLMPPPVVPYGLQPQAGPIAGSAIALFDFGVDTNALYAAATPSDTETPVHEGLRKQPSAISQMDQFLTDGTIVQTCPAVCNPN